MPKLPGWYVFVPAILQQLRGPDVPPFLDRPAIEKLFSIRRRQAIRVLAAASGYQVGKTFVVERQAVIEFLEEIENSGAAPKARARKQRIATALNEVANHAAAQSVQVRTAPDVLRRRPGNLPSAIELVAPGKLQISYRGAEDLLAKIVELAAAADQRLPGLSRPLRGTGVNAALDISLPRFEGPLDLLLALVRKNEVEITDIPIAEITRQYLEYLHQARELNIDLGADFVYFAALLIHIKSRSLLPGDPELAALEPDPREALVRQLMDHDQLRHGAEFLKQKLEIAEATWSRPPPPNSRACAEPQAAGPNPSLNLLQILRLAQQALATARSYDLVTPDDPVSVEEMAVAGGPPRPDRPVPWKGSPLLAEQPDAAAPQHLVSGHARDGPIVADPDGAGDRLRTVHHHQMSMWHNRALTSSRDGCVCSVGGKLSIPAT